MLNHEEITELFTHADGRFRLARWERPIVPVVFGVEDQSLQTIKGAIEAVVALAGHQMAETDPEQGANLMVFLFREWSELNEIPDIGKLVPGLDDLTANLTRQGANQYRHFRMEENGAIRAAFVFLRMDDTLSEMPAEDLALAQAAQVILLWGARAFADRSPLAVVGNTVVLRPEIGALIKAAYDPVMPSASEDSSQALRLAARLGQSQ